MCIFLFVHHSYSLLNKLLLLGIEPVKKIFISALLFMFLAVNDECGPRDGASLIIKTKRTQKLSLFHK